MYQSGRISFSSAKFYATSADDFGMLTNADD
jgi:hypothetical protein